MEDKLMSKIDEYLESTEVITEQTDYHDTLRQACSLKLRNRNNPYYLLWLNGISCLIHSKFLTLDDRETLRDFLSRTRRSG